MASLQMSKNLGETISNMKRMIIELFGTPRWISELSIMVNEVRDRTVLIKLNSQMHPINDLVIYHLFTEIGTVEDVRYMPEESGFHSRVRLRFKSSSDWAFHYYNGRRLHQGCCELEIHRINDVIDWNRQRIADLKDEYGVVDHPRVNDDDDPKVVKSTNEGKAHARAEMNNELIVAESYGCVEFDVVLNQGEKRKQNEISGAPVLAKKHSNPAAHQLFVEMPKLMEKETEVSDVLPKEIVLVENAVSPNVGKVALSFDPGGDGSMVANYDSFDVVTKINKDQEPELVDKSLEMVGLMEGCFDSATYYSKVLDETPELMEKWTEMSVPFPKETVQVSSIKEQGALSFDPGGEPLMVARQDVLDEVPRPWIDTQKGSIRQWLDEMLTSSLQSSLVAASEVSIEEVKQNVPNMLMVQGTQLVVDVNKLTEKVWQASEDEEHDFEGKKEKVVAVTDGLTGSIKLPLVFDPGIIVKGVEAIVTSLGKLIDTMKKKALIVWKVTVGEVRMKNEYIIQIVQIIINNYVELVFDPGGGEELL